MKVLKDGENDNDVCASNLTYSEADHLNTYDLNKYFVGIKLWDQHQSSENIKEQFISALKQRSQEVTGNPAKFILRCKSYIYEKLEHVWSINNEAEVCYALANPIVGMFCDSFGYRLELEDTDEIQTQTNVLGQSKADYVCWVLRAWDGSRRGSYSNINDVSVVILETKHRNNYSDGFAQTLGYYVKSKSETGTDQAGLAILLNEMDSEITVIIFLFPYHIQDEQNRIGMQSLMLPAFSYKNECDFVKSNFIELLYLLCMSVKSNGEKLPSVLQMECSVELIEGR